MDPSGQAAEQLIKITFEGIRFTLKIAGAGSKRLAAILRSAAKDQRKTTGKTRLKTLLKSEKELTVFTVPDDRLKEFAREAKRYGVTFCMVREKKPRQNALTDILAKAEDGARISRILDRLGLGRENILREAPDVVTLTPNQQAILAAEDILSQMLGVQDAQKEAAPPNPQTARTVSSRPFEPSSGFSAERYDLSPAGPGQARYAEYRFSSEPEQRPSVRAELAMIRLEIAQNEIPEPDEIALSQQFSKILGKE